MRRSHASLAMIASALALGGVAVATPSLTPGDAAAVATAQRDGVSTQRRDMAPPAQTPTRSLTRVMDLSPFMSVYSSAYESIWLGRVRDSAGRPMGSRLGKRGLR